MKPESEEQRSRYDTSGNVEAEYVDENNTVLVNKKGLIELAPLQILEEEALASAYDRLLSELRTDSPMTCDLLKHIHACIFGDLYEWAGRWRTVWISKPGITWAAPDFLDRNMEEFEKSVLRKYPAETLQTDEDFCRAAGEIQGEFLVIHPFREGNARTIKLLTNLLAAQSGRPLLVYDQTAEGTQRYIEAAEAAFKREYAPMVKIIRAALTEAQKSR